MESRPLFRLFFSTTDVKRGGERLDELTALLRQMQAPVAARRRRDRRAAGAMRVLVALGNLVVPAFPYQVSKAVYCEGLPRLLGRATIEVVVARSRPPSAGGAPDLSLLDGPPPLGFVWMVDGYAAPVTAGNFVDLVQRGFYNGLPWAGNRRRSAAAGGGMGGNASSTAAAAGSAATGSAAAAPPPSATAGGARARTRLPPRRRRRPLVGAPAAGGGGGGGGGAHRQPEDVGSSSTGFVDPRTGQYRSIPREILPAGATEPVYRSATARSAAGFVGERRAKPAPPLGRPALPFRAVGSLGMLHSPADADDGASAFFVATRALADGSEAAAAFDGAYTLFGFVLDGVDDLALLREGDVIQSMRVLNGGDLLQRPGFNPRYAKRPGTKSLRDYQMLSGEQLGDYDGGVIPGEVPLAVEDADAAEKATRAEEAKAKQAEAAAAAQ